MVSNGHDGPERDERQPVVRVADHARTTPLLRRVVGEQALARHGVVVGLLRRLQLRLHRKRVPGPDLAVRVRVAGAHRRTAVLEDLHPAVALAELGGLVGPDVDHVPDRGLVHARQGHVVTGREAHDAAGATGSLGPEQPAADRLAGGVRAERREVVGEHEGGRVVRVHVPRDPRVARAEVAVGIVDRALLGRFRLLGAQPGALRPARGHQHPLPGQRVAPPVRLGIERGDLAVVGTSGRAVGHGSGLLQAIRRAPSDAATSNTRGVRPVRAG